MKIVHVEDYFIPDAGYQINIMPKYLAKFGHEVYIVTSKPDGIKKTAADFFGSDRMDERDALYTKQTGVHIIRVAPATTKTVSGRMIFDKRLFHAVDGLNPDVVYVHGNDTLTGIRYLLKRNLPYRLVTDSHMLSMASMNKFSRLFCAAYKTLVTPKIIKKQIPVIRTQDDEYVKDFLGIPLSQAPWISYGSDTLLFHPNEDEKQRFRRENGISPDDFVVVYAGKLDETKGGQLLADAIKEPFHTKKNLVFLIVGSTPGDYGAKVKETLDASQNRILCFPTQKYADLGRFFQAADLAVFAKQCSLSFYDAEACALPVLSEDNNINIDRCSHDNGWTFKAGDMADFREKIAYAADMDAGAYQAVCENAYRFISLSYNYEDKAREYEQIITNQKKDANHA